MLAVGALGQITLAQFPLPMTMFPIVFSGAQYRLLGPHYVNGATLTTNSIVTEGVELPIGWQPTLAVDPLNGGAIIAFYSQGPRNIAYEDLNPYASSPYAFYTVFGILAPATHWIKLSSNLFQLTGLGAGLPPVGE
jgi:hypothetical protein